MESHGALFDYLAGSYIIIHEFLKADLHIYIYASELEPDWLIPHIHERATTKPMETS